MFKLHGKNKWKCKQQQQEVRHIVALPCTLKWILRQKN
jgi:hypothetical protein